MRRIALAIATTVATLGVSLGVAPSAQARAWCTHDFPVAPPYAQCVNYGFGNSDGGYCWLNQPAYTTDGRAIPSSCAYYYNTPPTQGRPPLPQIVPPRP